jgi:hypothetical protein
LTNCTLPKHPPQKQGSRNVEDCIQSFVEPGSSTGSHFDYIPMSEDALTPFDGANSADACKQACSDAAGAADGCQYFEFRSAMPAGAPRCYLRLRGIAPPGAFEDTDPLDKALFQVRGARVGVPVGDGLGSLGLERPVGVGGSSTCADSRAGLCGLAALSGWTLIAQPPWVRLPTIRIRKQTQHHVKQVRTGTFAAFAAHPSDWDTLGTPLLGTETHFANLPAASAACGATNRCAGIKFSLRGGTLPWQLFSAALHDAISGRLRLTGPEINPWVPPPPGS